MSPQLHWPAAPCRPWSQKYGPPPTAKFITSICDAVCNPGFPPEQQMLLSRPFTIAQRDWKQILQSGETNWSITTECSVFSAAQQHLLSFCLPARFMYHICVCRPCRGKDGKCLLWPYVHAVFNCVSSKNNLTGCEENAFCLASITDKDGVTAGHQGKMALTKTESVKHSWCVMPSYTNIWLFMFNK